MANLVWYASRVNAMTTTIPAKALGIAATGAARLAAAKAGGGAMSRELARPKIQSGLSALVGTSKVYGPIQQWGGSIRPKRPGGRLLIGANRGRITASADVVHIKGKHFLEPAAAAFPALYVSALRRLMPG